MKPPLLAINPSNYWLAGFFESDGSINIQITKLQSPYFPLYVTVGFDQKILNCFIALQIYFQIKNFLNTLIGMVKFRSLFLFREKTKVCFDSTISNLFIYRAGNIGRF